jgi:hypothetical protein
LHAQQTQRRALPRPGQRCGHVKAGAVIPDDQFQVVLELTQRHDHVLRLAAP